MRQNTLFTLGIALASALVISPMAWADEGGGYCGGKGHAMSRHGGHGHGGGTTHLLRHLLKNKQELGLTDEQVTKLRTTALDADRARIRAEADAMISERELRAMMWDEKAQLPAIEAKVKEKEALEATVRIIGIRARRELIGVLTPEQQVKQKALWEHHRSQNRRDMMRAETGESTNDANDNEADRDDSEVGRSAVESGASAG